MCAQLFMIITIILFYFFSLNYFRLARGPRSGTVPWIFLVYEYLLN